MRILLLALIILAGCAKKEIGVINIPAVSSNGDKTQNIINHWSLPDIPNKYHSLYNTPTGVDENYNDIRDDIEVKNAVISYPDETLFRYLNLHAKYDKKMIDAYKEKNKNKAVDLYHKQGVLLFCEMVLFKDDKSDELHSIILQQRKDFRKNKEKLYNSVDSFVESSLPSVVSFPTYDVLERDCPRLIYPEKYKYRN